MPSADMDAIPPKTMPSYVQPRLCGLCASPRIGFAFLKGGFAVWRCGECDFRFVHPALGDTADIYGRDYFSGASRGFGYMNYDEDKVAAGPFFEAVLERIERLVPPGQRKLLDVGAATGFFIKLASNRGWSGQGLEVSGYAVSRARESGADVRLGTLGDRPFPPGSFNAITLLDVIEHVSDPAAMLDECRRLLRPGGVIAINTPDASSVWARIFGQRWHAYCPPEHLSYFNPRNLGFLLERRGFKALPPAKIAKRFTPAYVLSMLGRWQGIAALVRLAAAVEASPLKRLRLPLNIRDNFFIIGLKH